MLVAMSTNQGEDGMATSTMLTVDEAAAELRAAGWKMSRSTLYECVRRGQIPAVRLGRSLRISRKALSPYLGDIRPGAEG